MVGALVGDFWSRISAILITNIVNVLRVLTGADTQNKRTFAWLTITSLLAIVIFDTLPVRTSCKIALIVDTVIEDEREAIRVVTDVALANIVTGQEIEATQAATGCILDRVTPILAIARAN